MLHSSALALEVLELEEKRVRQVNSHQLARQIDGSPIYIFFITQVRVEYGKIFYECASIFSQAIGE